jgi:hypothetical protein
MAQQIQNITITAPGFAGINTQDAPLSQDPSFCAIADNCVIDKQGRVAARKGAKAVTTNGPAVLGSSAGIKSIKQFRDDSGATLIFSAGNNKIFTGTTTLVDVTPAAYTITADNWKMVTLNEHIYLFQRGYVPLVYSTATTPLSVITAHPGYNGTAPNGHEALAAFGRLWVADTTTNKSTIFWSDLLEGSKWTGGSSGSIDITKVWPNGYDEIVALAAHNGFLIIFGKESIVIYEGADDPSTMTLHDTILSIGCVNRDAVTSTGKDLVFLDKSGLRSLSRTIQEKSAPLGDISKNVDEDIKLIISNETGNIQVHYSPTEAFVITLFPNQDISYIFDTKRQLEDGSYRATTWTSMGALCFTNLIDDTLYIGTSTGISTYSGFNDDTATYVLTYSSHPLTFGNSSTLKFLKKINVTTFNGADALVTLSWAYDYATAYKKRSYTLPATSVAQYGESEYNEGAEYSTSITLINREKVNANGQGTAVSVGLETTIDGNSIAIQELNIQALVGKII